MVPGFGQKQRSFPEGGNAAVGYGLRGVRTRWIHQGRERRRLAALIAGDKGALFEAAVDPQVNQGNEIVEVDLTVVIEVLA